MTNQQKGLPSFAKANLPVIGIGIGLRGPMLAETLAARDKIDWLEFTPENYFVSSGRNTQRLTDARRDFALISHGVSLSLGSNTPLSADYLRELKEVLDVANAAWFSDHLSYSSVDDHFVPDLFPLPLTHTTANHVIERIKETAAFVGRPMLIENISYYENAPGEMSEADFIKTVAEGADCGILLDLNNLYLNSINLKFDPYKFLASIPLDRVVQVHMAGHMRTSKYLIDSHGEKIAKEVYAMLEYLLSQTSVNAITLERDQNFPEFAEILYEVARIREISDKSKVVETPRPTPVQIIQKSATAVDAVKYQREFFDRLFELSVSGKVSGKTTAKSKADALTTRMGQEIYSQAVRYRYIELIETFFSTSSAIAGKTFIDIGLEYFASNPGASYNQLDSVKDFPEYLKHYRDGMLTGGKYKSKHKQLLTKLPYIPELARLEYLKMVRESVKVKALEQLKDQRTASTSQIIKELGTIDGLKSLAAIKNPTLKIEAFEYPVQSLLVDKCAVCNRNQDPDYIAIVCSDSPANNSIIQISNTAKQMLEALPDVGAKPISYLDLVSKLATSTQDKEPQTLAALIELAQNLTATELIISGRL